MGSLSSPRKCWGEVDERASRDGVGFAFQNAQSYIYTKCALYFFYYLGWLATGWPVGYLYVLSSSTHAVKIAVSPPPNLPLACQYRYPLSLFYFYYCYWPHSNLYIFGENLASILTLYLINSQYTWLPCTELGIRVQTDSSTFRDWEMLFSFLSPNLNLKFEWNSISSVVISDAL